MILVLIMGNIPGLEIVRPMAIVILGGLVTSALINLFALPALFLSLRVASVQELDLPASTDTTQDDLFGNLPETPRMVAGK